MPWRMRSAFKRDQSAADRGRAGGLSGVRDRAEPAIASDGEGARERLRRVLGASKADADNAPLAVGDGVLRRLLAELGVEDPRDVGRETHLDAVPLACLLDAVAVALEDLLPRDAARRPARPARRCPRRRRSPVPRASAA